VEGEGIQCIIKNISGDGHKKRYDDPLAGLMTVPWLIPLQQMVRCARPRT
jgi:hypothetical protein